METTFLFSVLIPSSAQPLSMLIERSAYELTAVECLDEFLLLQLLPVRARDGQ